MRFPSRNIIMRSRPPTQPVVLQQPVCSLSIFGSPLHHLPHESKEGFLIATFEVLLGLLQTRAIWHGHPTSPLTCWISKERRFVLAGQFSPSSSRNSAVLFPFFRSSGGGGPIKAIISGEMCASHVSPLLGVLAVKYVLVFK